MRSRSPGWRRSRTACPRSGGRSRRTRPPRWCGWACCSARCSSAISVLAHHLKPYPSHDRTVMAQMGLAVFGNGPAFVFLQFATAAILTLAANTAYNGFPSLSSIIAKDGYLPRQLAHRGDRLVFSNGIIMLAAAAAGSAGRVQRDHQRAHPALRGRACSRRSRCRSGAWCATTEAAQAGLAAQRRRSTRSGRWRRWSCCSSSRSRSSRAARGCRSSVIPLIVLLFKAIRSHYDAVGRGPARPARLAAAPAAPRRGGPRPGGRRRACSKRVAYAQVDRTRPSGRA